jgi:hypothetical protein
MRDVKEAILNIDHELAKADKLLSEAHAATASRQSIELGHRALAELLGAILIKMGEIHEVLKKDQARGK